VLVSDSHKLVFVHIQKTGGSTVHRLLEERIPDLRSILTRHAFASRGKQELDGWNDYYKFALVRNPWERLVWRYVRDNSSNFREFTYNCTDEIRIKKGVYYSFVNNQLDYVTDEDGDLLVDFIAGSRTSTRVFTRSPIGSALI
jgi:hypothetical protein